MGGMEAIVVLAHSAPQGAVMEARHQARAVPQTRLMAGCFGAAQALRAARERMLLARQTSTPERRAVAGARFMSRRLFWAAMVPLETGDHCCQRAVAALEV